MIKPALCKEIAFGDGMRHFGQLVKPENLKIEKTAGGIRIGERIVKGQLQWFVCSQIRTAEVFSDGFTEESSLDFVTPIFFIHKKHLSHNC